MQTLLLLLIIEKNQKLFRRTTLLLDHIIADIQYKREVQQCKLQHDIKPD